MSPTRLAGRRRALALLGATPLLLAVARLALKGEGRVSEAYARFSVALDFQSFPRPSWPRPARAMWRPTSA